MKRNLFTAALLTLLSGFFTPVVAAPDQNPRGIYVYSWDIAIDNPPPPVCEACPSSPTQDLVNSLARPGVDGLTLVVDWSIVEPRPGLYQWDLTNVADWSSSATYVRGDAVSYNSDIYLSLTNGNRQKQPDKAVNNWQLVGCLNQPCKVGGTSPNLLDQWIALAASLGKSVNLAVRAGGGNTGFATPCWLYDQKSAQCGAGYTGGSSYATALQFDVSAHQGVGKCVAETIAAPWDSSFLIEWNAMLAALSTHLQTTIVNGAREYDVVSMIRLTGINRTTDEFRLPEQMPNTLGSCTKAIPPIQPIPSIQQWLYPPAPLAAYRPSILIDPNSQTGAWVDITKSFATNFPGKDFNVAIIPDKTGSGQNSGIPQYPFPEIDDNGCVYSPPLTTADIDQYLTPRPCIVTSSIPDQNKHLLSQASQAFPGHVAIEFESLNTTKPANPYVVRKAQALNTGAAFMTNDWGGAKGSVCKGGLSGQPCQTSTEYFTLLKQGIFLPTPANPIFRGQYLEVFYPNVISFPCAIWQAHVDLTDYTPPVTAVTISGPAGQNGWYRGPTDLNFSASDASTSNSSCPLPIMTQFSLNDGSNWTTGNSLALTQDGIYQVLFRSTDVAGNVETPSRRDVLIDSTPPVTTVTTHVHSIGGVPISLEVDLNSFDNLSGVAATEYSLDHGATWTRGNILFLCGGTRRLLFRSTDVAGNVEKQKSITVSAPSCAP
jgi:hypothetical protein